MITLSEVLAVFERDSQSWCESEIAGQLGVEQSQLQAPLEHLIRMGRLEVQAAGEVCEICPQHSSCLLITPPTRTYKLARLSGETTTRVRPAPNQGSGIRPSHG